MDTQDRRLVYTLRRCKGQWCRPAGIGSDDVLEAIRRGLLKFNEWPGGHFEITETGRAYLAELSE